MMFNLNDTHHESGIIIYGDDTVAVYNWMSCGENELPMVSPIGQTIAWPVDNDEDEEMVHVGHVDDIRDYLPGTIRQDEDGITAHGMDIACDENNDLPALFGFCPSASHYDGNDTPYSGDIWELPGGVKVITIDIWG